MLSGTIALNSNQPRDETVQTPPPLSSFTSPKYWPTWIGIGFLCIVAWLPLKLRLGVGAMLGRATWLLGRERRYITEVNIRLCFPELDAAGQRDLVYRSFIENGIGLIETTTGWIRKPEAFRHLLRMTGTEHLDRAIARKKGVVLLGAHYTTLDFSANLFSRHYPMGVTYRPHNNKLFDAFMLRGRLQNCTGVFDRFDLRGAFRHLKEGHLLWYAPDQDYGPEHAVFAPFFGQKAATISVTSRFAKINDSPVLLVRHHRRGGSVPYEIEFIPMPADFPGEDEVANATLINAKLEEAIRHYPAQYLWMHKRFKTQPGGKPESPYINIRTSVRKIGKELYLTAIKDAKRIEDITSRMQILKLQGGEMLRSFPAGTFNRLRQVRKLDRHAKMLRSHGIGSITLDNILYIPDLLLTAAIYFEIPGERLSTLSRSSLPLQELAVFLARVHSEGFMFTTFNPAKILYDGEDFHILAPEETRKFPSAICYADRKRNIEELRQSLDLSSAETALFVEAYLEASGLGSAPRADDLLTGLTRL